MLSNREKMSLDRLHSMLKLIASASSGSSSNSSKGLVFDMNPIELQQYLQIMVSSEKLELIDGQYSRRL